MRRHTGIWLALRRVTHVRALTRRKIVTDFRKVIEKKSNGRHEVLVSSLPVGPCPPSSSSFPLLPLVVRTIPAFNPPPDRGLAGGPLSLHATTSTFPSLLLPHAGASPHPSPSSSPSSSSHLPVSLPGLPFLSHHFHTRSPLPLLLPGGTAASSSLPSSLPSSLHSPYAAPPLTPPPSYVILPVAYGRISVIL